MTHQKLAQKYLTYKQLKEVLSSSQLMELKSLGRNVYMALWRSRLNASRPDTVQALDYCKQKRKDFLASLGFVLVEKELEND